MTSVTLASPFMTNTATLITTPYDPTTDPLSTAYTGNGTSQNNSTPIVTGFVPDPAYGPTDMPHWASSNITYSLGPNIDPTSQAAIAKAFAYWAQFDGLSFTNVGSSGNANIQISWGNLDNAQLGLAETVQNQGTHSTFISSTIVLEDPSVRPFDAGTTVYAGTDTDLVAEAAHQIGFAIGLGTESLDPNAVMYSGARTSITMATITGSTAPHPFVDSNESLPLTILYGDRDATTYNDPNLPPTVRLSGDEAAVYRFFDSSSGTQFLTNNASERDSIIQTNPTLRYEGLSMAAFNSPSNDPNASEVFRFFNTANGTHFFTTNATEAANVAATRTDMVQEQSGMFEHKTQEAGDSAVYRFFNSNDGTHFYTTSAAENASLIQTRPDMVSEGVAFYAPTT